MSQSVGSFNNRRIARSLPVRKLLLVVKAEVDDVDVDLIMMLAADWDRFTAGREEDFEEDPLEESRGGRGRVFEDGVEGSAPGRRVVGGGGGSTCLVMEEEVGRVSTFSTAVGRGLVCSVVSVLFLPMLLLVAVAVLLMLLLTLLLRWKSLCFILFSCFCLNSFA